MQNIRYHFVTFTCPALCSRSKNLQETGCISAFTQLVPMRKSLHFWFALNLIHSSLTFLILLVKPSLRPPLSVWNRNSRGTGLDFCMGDKTASLHIKGGTLIFSSKAAVGFWSWQLLSLPRELLLLPPSPSDLPFTHFLHHSSYWCACVLSSYEPPEKSHPITVSCVCVHIDMFVYVFALLWCGEQLQHFQWEWAAAGCARVLLQSTGGEQSLGLHWGRVGRVAGGKHKAQLTCLPLSATASSGRKPLAADKQQQRSWQVVKNQHSQLKRTIAMIHLPWPGPLWLALRYQNLGLTSLIMKGERKWKMRRWILSRIRVALLDGIFLCTAGKKNTKRKLALIFGSRDKRNIDE